MCLDLDQISHAKLLLTYRHRLAEDKMTTLTLPHLPCTLALTEWLLSPAQVTLVLTKLARQWVQRPFGLRRQFGAHAKYRFLVDFTNPPFRLLLAPGTSSPRVTTRAPRRPLIYAARIAGLLAAFLGVMHSNLGGDTLFFSRNLVIEGDTAAGLALRDALGDTLPDTLPDADADAGAKAIWHRAIADAKTTEADVVILADSGLLAHAAKNHHGKEPRAI